MTFPIELRKFLDASLPSVGRNTLVGRHPYRTIENFHSPFLVSASAGSLPGCRVYQTKSTVKGLSKEIFYTWIYTRLRVPQPLLKNLPILKKDTDMATAEGILERRIEQGGMDTTSGMGWLM